MGFNPSFTGIALVAIAVVSVDVITPVFQSFFYWNCLGGTYPHLHTLIISEGFNPSFTGIALVAIW